MTLCELVGGDVYVCAYVSTGGVKDCVSPCCAGVNGVPLCVSGCM